MRVRPKPTDPAGPVPESLWRRLAAQPDRAPELIALGAAERFGPQAQDWAARNAAWHEPANLARKAVTKHVHMARLEGAALGIGGAFSAAADLVGLVWIQSRMVFFVAAAFGFDPRHPMRPAELLVLQGVYETPAEARQALDGAGKRLGQAVAERAIFGGRERTLQARLVRYAGKRVAQRYGGRLIPLVGAPIGAVQNGSATKELGRRAIAYYGRPSLRRARRRAPPRR